MAERPIFIPDGNSPGFVREVSFSIKWATGFAPIQKQKNVIALHSAAHSAGYHPILEISSKSEERAGRHLSAFHLIIDSEIGQISLESAFQGSKIFERGGPYRDIYMNDARSAKKDPRLRTSGKLIGFEFEGTRFSLEPMTGFYDWLYIRSIFPHREWIKKRIDGEVIYSGYSDIEFNPAKSINCQARSCALFVSLCREGLLESAMQSPVKFRQVLQINGAKIFQLKHA